MKVILTTGIASMLAGLFSGCSARKEVDYSYPYYPYYVSHDDCGNASPAQCSEARAQAKVIAGDATAATWGSLVALTLLASIDIEPDTGR